MKIVIHTLEQINGVEIYPIISLIIFFVFFIIIGIQVFTADKEYIDEMKNMPLDGNDDFEENFDNQLNNKNL
ncbi:MAG: hypothetical protein GXO86_13275 [Chlorobi bacterium]|nr:hypothetical protein [Chlorobiota bacterium]